MEEYDQGPSLGAFFGTIRVLESYRRSAGDPMLPEPNVCARYATFADGASVDLPPVFNEND